MNTQFRSLFLLLCFSLIFAIGSADAQYYGKKKKKKKKKPTTEKAKESKDLDAWLFKDRLWYGGGFNLGFNGNQNFSFFQFGLSPMVGYKIIEQWSVGPRLGFNYSYIKGTGTDFRQAVVQPFDFEVGAFTRFKVLPIIFTHLEYSIANNEQVFVSQNGLIAVDTDGVPITERETLGNLYFGLGYTSDAELGYELLVLFNFLEDRASNQLPFSIRAGFNFRF